jgi:hypothetical protein
MRIRKFGILAALSLTACLEGPAGPPGADGADGVDGEDGLDGRSVTLFVQEGVLWDSAGIPDQEYGTGWKYWRVDVPTEIGSKMEAGAIVQVYGQVLGLGWKPLIFELTSIERRLLIYNDQCLSSPCTSKILNWDYRIIVAN